MNNIVASKRTYQKASKIMIEISTQENFKYSSLENLFEFTNTYSDDKTEFILNHNIDNSFKKSEVSFELWILV